MTFTKHKLPWSEKLKGATEEVNNKWKKLFYFQGTGNACDLLYNVFT